jgi:glycerate dehydrogenase
MKIVVLDGYVLNPGDLSWDKLNNLGEVVLYDRTPADKIIERSLGAEVVITNKTPLSEQTIHNLPSLKYIGVLATGYNVVDTAAAKRKNIIVTNVPSYSTMSLLLELCHHVQRHSDSVIEGKLAILAQGPDCRGGNIHKDQKELQYNILALCALWLKDFNLRLPL